MQVLEVENEEDEQQLLREQAELEAAEAEEAEEAVRAAEEALLDEDGKRKTVFNFSGMSFAEYVKSIKESLNIDMK